MVAISDKRVTDERVTCLRIFADTDRAVGTSAFDPKPTSALKPFR
jgi:hypothetical protein